MAQTLRRRDLWILPFGLACPPLAADSPSPSQYQLRSTYRIDIAILPFGVRIFSLREVGYGSALLHIRSIDGETSSNFEFGGASIPERSRGIRQVGYFEEQITQTGFTVRSSRYFGFISSTPDMAPNQASLHLATARNPKDQLCCAVEGHISDGSAGFQKTYSAPLPADAGLDTLPGLRKIMRQALADICATGCLKGQSRAIPPKTFLSVLAEASLGASPVLNTNYQYGDQVLRFQSTRRNISGQIVVDAEVQGKSRHRFSFTCPDSGRPELPHRIEYQPKSWLRLTLTAVQEQPSSKEST